MKQKCLFLLVFMLFLLNGMQIPQVKAQTESSPTNLLLPKPQQLSENGASFSLNRDVRLTDPTGSELLASLFTTAEEAPATVTVNLVDAATLGTFDYTLAGFDNEGYKLNVATDAITITAVTKTGVIRAAQTLMQLAAAADGAYIQGVDITDYPAFKLRGYMHDVGRSFISFDELKKEIDLLARFKVNVFHWHLTDNQGFRFESKVYPQLNQASNMTRFAGSYYTQEQCTELEAYAAERGVIVIPEIDMPGHSTAFTNAMGYTMSSDAGKVALKALLSELAAAFPLAPYIHMGADEAGTTAAFVNEMSQYIKETLGRKCIVWNPISGVSISTSTLPYIDMTEMWSTSGRKISGVPNIDCRYNYINHFDVFADLVGIYKSNVYYAQQGSSEVAGAITAIWNDRKTATETDIISQNGLYAHALATAERGWMGGGNQYIEVGGTTLPNSGSEYEEFVDWERRFLHYKDTWLSEEPIPYVKQTNVKWRITQAFPNGGTASAVFPPETATDDILPDQFTYDGKTYTTSMATGAGIYLRHVWGTTVPAFYTSPVLNTTAYAWTYVYSPTEQTAGALIEFQNYSRSENDKAPDAGNWDRKGSRIWVNGEEVLPPTWTNSGKNINSEVDLGNENFPAREPISIHLNAGWNKVLLKLPYVSASSIRLNKWMFTFVLTDATGRNALDGIVYSPIQSLDENVEGVVSLIGEVKQYVNENCGTAIGYYPLSAAATLMSKVEEIEGTLQESMTATEREAQVTALEAAFTTFKNGLSSQAINQPLPSTLNEKHYYTLCTPLRGTRYVTATGTAAELAGATSVTDASYWKFVTRTDGTFDIVNAINGSYISPSAANNNALMTQASQPSSGWTLSKAATAGYVIISSGSCQFNQTNNSSSALSGAYRVFNWGGGNNTSDTGCQYLIEEADVNFDGNDVLDGGSTSDGTRVLTVGSQVTTEAGITSGKVYILKTGADRYITDNGTNYDVPNTANSPTEASAYYLISNGNGTWKIKNYHTGKYWGVPVYNSNLASVEEASAGAWSLNVSGGVAYPSALDAGNTARGIDRSGGKVWSYTVGNNNNHKVYIYEVSLSTAAAFDEFSGKDIRVGTTPESTISTGTWYVMSQRSRTTYVYEDASSHTLKHTLNKPGGLATTNANYLIRLVTGTDGKYYLQNGLGNYVGQITASTNVPTTAMKDMQHTVAKISGANGHYYIQCVANNVVLDANDFTYGDPSTVVGWGTTPPTSTGGNNDWAFYPIELVDSWVPTVAEVYTINNTKSSNRGALVYDGSSKNVGLVASASLNATNANHQWVLCPTGTEKQYYLYNVGAGKFAIPTAIGESASNAWVFSDDAVAVTLSVQGDGTYRIKMAKDPISGTNQAVIGVNQNTAIKVFNYNDAGSDFTFTKVDGANQSVAANAAVAKLVKNQTALTSYPQTSGWYAIQIKSRNGAASYVGRYLQTASSLYNDLYPLTFTGGVDVQPAITDPSFLTYIDCTSWDVNTWQLADGRYLVDNGSNKFPTPSGTPGNVICGYDNGNYFKNSNNFYADPYNSGTNYFIGETTTMRTAYTVYPIDLATAGLAAWKVSISNSGSSTQLTCNRADVNGQSSVYHGGWFFLPADVTPVASDFSMEGMIGAPVFDAENKTITVTYDPSISFLPGDVNIVQGHETTGKGNTMQALLRAKVTPFTSCTPTQFNVTLSGAEQLDKVAIYATTIDEIQAEGANPVKIGEAAAANGAIEIAVDASEHAAGTTLYYWITADVKADATELATVDASLNSIAYTNAHEGNTCDLSSVGNPDGVMRIYKQQAFLWTASHTQTRYYRIPTILTTADGGIVALTDFRYDNTEDLGKPASGHKIDVMMRKSMDNGATWSAEQAVAVGDGSTVAGYGYGDPAIVRTNSGKLICLMAAGKNSYPNGMLHMAYAESTDNGATWTAPADIFNDIDKGGVTFQSVFTTAGKGITFSNGRVAFAMNGKVNGTTNDYILYSDDEGASWKIVPSPAFTGGDESKLEIMNDNSLLISVRRGGWNSMANRGYNRTTGDASGDGISSWGTQGTWDNTMNANGCNADILYYSRSTEGKPDIMLHTLTKDFNTYRRDLRLYMSIDQGATWTEVYKLQPGFAAYSSMQKLANGDLAIIYEDGSIGNKDKMDCYAMNYIVISKEQIAVMYENCCNPLGFSQAATYVIKNEGNSKYISSTAEAGTGYAKVADSESNAAAFVMIPVFGQSGYYYMYDTESGNYLVPDNTNIHLDTSHWSWTTNPTAVRVRQNASHNNNYVLGANCAASGTWGDRNSGEYLGNFQQGSPSLALNHWVIELGESEAIVEMNKMTAGVQSLVESAALLGTQLQYTAVVDNVARGTVVVPFEADVTGDVEVYVLDDVDEVKARVVGTPVETIEANQPVLLKNSGTLVLTAKEGTLEYNSTPEEGLLKGVYETGMAPIGSYVLQKQNDLVAFYKVADADHQPTIKPFRAYLEAPSTARVLSIGFDDEVTGISSLSPNALESEGSYYSLDGRKLTGKPVQRGIYVVNGKKVVIK